MIKSIGIGMLKLNAASLLPHSLILLSIFLSFGLPSSGVYGVPIRDFVAVVSAMWLFSLWLIFPVHFSSKAIITLRLALGALLMLMLWMLIALISGVEQSSILGQAKAILSTLILPILVLMYRSFGNLPYRYYLIATCLGVLCFMLTKLGILSYSLGSGSDPTKLFQVIFGVSPVAMDMGEGLFRLQFNNDIVSLVVFLVALILRGDKNAGLPKWLFVILALVTIPSIVISFSRFLFALLAVFVFVELIVRRKFNIIIILAALSVAAYSVNFLNISTAIDLRFNEKVAAGSDDIRYKESTALYESWSESPLLGKGVGAYSPEYIRANDPGLLYLYEVQWLAFLMQFGLIGIIPVVALYLSPFLAGVNARWNGVMWYVMALYAAFLFSGLSNPYLLSNVSGGLIAFMLITIRYVAESREACGSASRMQNGLG